MPAKQTCLGLVEGSAEVRLNLLTPAESVSLLLETGEGPTLAFKDIGQQVVAQLLNYYLGKRNARANVLV